MREFFELINEYPITSLLVACFIIKRDTIITYKNKMPLSCP